MKQIIFTFVLSLGFALSYGQLRVNALGDVGIGTTNPERPLEVVGQIMSSNFNTYPQSKQSNFLMRHYDQSATHFAYFNAQSDANNNQVLFGGGAGSQYAATVVAFMTGANRTTLLGTEGMRLNNLQRVRVSTTGGAITHDLTVYGSAAKTGGGSWDVPSDKRIKKDISPFTDGLEQILQIKPINFTYIPEFDVDQKPQIGVIAQDMLEIAPYTVNEVELIYESDEKENRKARGLKSIYAYNESALTYMLVNAIKEQNAEILEKEERITDLEDRFFELERRLEGLGSTDGTSLILNQSEVTLKGYDLAAVEQNEPNPFNGYTLIDYVIPSRANSAQIDIYSIEGRLIKTVSIDHVGEGRLTVNVEDLPAGTYSYQLVVDGNKIDTKKMVLSN